MVFTPLFAGVVECSSNDVFLTYPCEHAFDGNVGTFYHSTGSNEEPWLRGNLGQVFTITGALFINRAGEGGKRGTPYVLFYKLWH